MGVIADESGVAKLGSLAPSDKIVWEVSRFLGEYFANRSLLSYSELPLHVCVCHPSVSRNPSMCIKMYCQPPYVSTVTLTAVNPGCSESIPPIPLMRCRCLRWARLSHEFQIPSMHVCATRIFAASCTSRCSRYAVGCST